MVANAMPQIKGSVIRPDDSRYEEARKIWNGAIAKRPALIAQCVDEADAAAALAYARREGLSISIRGGGHNVAGTALVEDGVVVDFSRLRGVDVDPRRRRVRVQPGALWGDVDAATQAHGLAVPAGIVTHTGVAGLTLGGGFGWLSRRWGLTSDHLISARVLLADGSRVIASADDHPGLFWALQGGGGNFGIVTQFEFGLHELGTTVLAGPILHRAERASEVLRFYRDFIAGAPDTLAVFVVLRTAPALDWVPEHLRGTPVAMLIPFWSGDLEQGERVLAPLRRFGPPAADLVERKPYTAHQQMLDAGVPHGWGYYWKSHFLPPLGDAAIAVLVAQAWRKWSPASYTLIFHLGGAISQVPQDASAHAGRQAAHAINVNAAWTEGGPEHADIAWAHDFFQAMQPHATGGVYVNFLSNEGEERVRAAYGPSYGRLAAIKAHYDPAGADLLNDAWGGAEPALAHVAAAHDLGLVCSHANGLPPRTRPHRPAYGDVVAEVRAHVTAEAARAVAAGVRPDRIVIDPAHDFGKNTWQSLELTRRTAELAATGWPVLVAVSHKDFVGETLGLGVAERGEGTLAVLAVCAWEGARLFRVHDVRAAREALAVVTRLRAAHAAAPRPKPGRTPRT